MSPREPKRSKRHHYLPQEYLTGFVDDEGVFTVYDKKEDSMFISNTNGAFFQNHLNTVVLPSGEKSDFLEKLYAEFENQSWSSLNAIRSEAVLTGVDFKTRADLFLFLSVLHWRLPSNFEHADRLVKEAFEDESKVGYFSLFRRDGSPASAEEKEAIRQLPAWKKAFRLTIPFAPFVNRPTWGQRIMDWRFVRTGDEADWYIVGDNPIVTSGANDHDPVTCLDELIFPVSGNTVLISQTKRVNNALPPEFAVLLGIAIIERSTRFVASSNPSFLSAIVGLYRQHENREETDQIIPELFEMIQ